MPPKDKARRTGLMFQSPSYTFHWSLLLLPLGVCVVEGGVLAGPSRPSFPLFPLHPRSIRASLSVPRRRSAVLASSAEPGIFYNLPIPPSPPSS
ncbi:Isopentenyl-diphosphate Delta-isomerase [Fusarium oxysporum f. sp. albedinis]|nr:Isopentenyl-diphosphate Delta-isomerase [Fusarium oxysporum f. sp. albedinis]